MDNNEVAERLVEMAKKLAGTTTRDLAINTKNFDQAMDKIRKAIDHWGKLKREYPDANLEIKSVLKQLKKVEGLMWEAEYNIFKG